MTQKPQHHHSRSDLTVGIARVLGPLQYVMAVAALCAITIYCGFDSNAVDRRLLSGIIKAADGVFIFGVIFNLIFSLRARSGSSMFIRRAADLLILLTLPALVWPGGASYGSLHWLYTRGFFFIATALYAFAELSYGTMQLLGRRTNPSLILSVSFLIFIFIGSLLLMLPKCTHTPLRYIDALFMAASAVSMTGLSTIDAAATFTPAGWLVIAVLMQIGALGVITFTSFFALFFSGRPSIFNQILMRDFVYSKSIGSLMPVLRYILLFTLSVEALGAVAIYFTLPDNFGGGIDSRAAFAAFHSLSAFCNGGFTTLSDGFADPAILGGNPMFFVVVIVLILAGGIGFPNLVNFKEIGAEYLRRLRARITGRPHVKRTHIFDLNTKLVLIATAILFVGGALSFYILEYNHTLCGLSAGKKILRATFCSATVRTAGFAISGPTMWLGSTLIVAMMLMWIGCSSQSMGGGIKINAFAAVLLNLRAIVKGHKGVHAFGRSIAPTSIRRANAVVIFSILAVFVYSLAITILQPELPLGAVVFESFSAITTVGMSMGITDQLTDLSKIAIATAMFLGRVGIISVLCGIVGQSRDISSMLPSDDIIIN